MAWLIGIAVVILVLVVAPLLLRGVATTGNLEFWRLAATYPEDSMAMFAEQDCWQVFDEEPPGGYRSALPPGDWVGPFVVPLGMESNTRIVVFGHAPEYEESQRAFVRTFKPWKR